MDLLPSHMRLALLEYLPVVKYTLSDWLFTELKINENHQAEDGSVISAYYVAEILQHIFSFHEGRIFIANEREILIFVQWGRKNTQEALAQLLRDNLPPGSFTLALMPPNLEGLTKLELRIAAAVGIDNNFLNARQSRHDKVIMVADEDMSIRKFVKEALRGGTKVFEVGEADAVIKAYMEFSPDILLLDPALVTSPDMLRELLGVDTDAHILLLSDTPESDAVQHYLQMGVKGVLPKNFTMRQLDAVIAEMPRKTA